MPETQQEILRLSDVESGRAVYMQLLNRQQELNIAKSSAIGNVRIIDNAVTSQNRLNQKSFGSISWFDSWSNNIYWCVLRVFLRRGIESPEQIEELGINVYASIPVSESLAKSTAQRSKLIKNKGRNMMIS
jgi:tyrosine-protein kinase Etk/Wzc